MMNQMPSLITIDKQYRPLQLGVIYWVKRFNGQEMKAKKKLPEIAKILLASAHQRQ